MLLVMSATPPRNLYMFSAQNENQTLYPLRHQLHPCATYAQINFFVRNEEKLVVLSPTASRFFHSLLN